MNRKLITTLMVSSLAAPLYAKVDKPQEPAPEAPKDGASSEVTPLPLAPAPLELESGWIANVHPLTAAKGVDSQPPGESLGEFVVKTSPITLSAHEQTALKFWEEPSGYRLEGLFTAKEAGFYTFILELAMPPIELRFGPKGRRKVPGNLATTYSFVINGKTLMEAGMRPKESTRLSAEDKLCGWTRQEAISQYLQPGHYKVQIWFAAKGVRHLKPKFPRKYNVPSICPNVGGKIVADRNPADEVQLTVYVRRPGEHAPQPALVSDFAHVEAKESN